MSPQLPHANDFEIEISDIAPDGQGVGYYQGRRVLVPYTIPGEVLTVRAVAETEDAIIAQGIRFLEASADRVLPVCQHFGAGACGGCQWQHIDYEAQLALKTDIVGEQLRLNGIHEPPLQFAEASSAQWGYARERRFLPSVEGELGYLGTDGQTVVPIEECPIADAGVMALVDELNISLPTLKTLEVHIGDEQDRMLVIETTDDEAPELEITVPASLNFLLSHREPYNMIGATHIKQRIFERVFRITAGVFYRANIPQVERLVEVVMQYLEPRAKDRVLDVYGGIGTFSAFVAPHVRQVTYVDSYPPAVTDAEENLADLVNIDILEGRADAVLSEIVSNRQHPTYQCVLLDPPTQGLTHSVMEALRLLAIPRLVYVAQNPASFAHDTQVLVRQLGYHLMEIQPLDLMPQTAAIECVALFRRE